MPVGTLVTLHLPPGSPVAGLPWVITIGSLGDAEDWEPLVCGPYEHGHALALARAVAADDELMAVVEPVLPLDGVDAIRAEIELARTGAPDDAVLTEPSGAVRPGTGPVPEPAEVRAGWRRMALRYWPGGDH